MSTEAEKICGLKREDFQATVQGKKTDLSEESKESKFPK